MGLFRLASESLKKPLLVFPGVWRFKQKFQEMCLDSFWKVAFITRANSAALQKMAGTEFVAQNNFAHKDLFSEIEYSKWKCLLFFFYEP